MPPRHCDPTFDNDFGYTERRPLHHALDENDDEPPRLQPTQSQAILVSPSNRPTKQHDAQKDSIIQYQPLVDNNKIRWRESRSTRQQQQQRQHAEQDCPEQHYKPILPLTVSLPILNLIDMTAVALVVPLLVQYYKAAGVTNASQRELLSSVFSSSQIIGGLVLGALSDAGWLRRRTLLLLSFGGSAVSYFMIASSSSSRGGGLVALIVSRVLVGLVKQTMTVTTSMLTQCTTKENRAAHMGRLTASSTVAWVVGPSVGALLYKYVDERAPAFVASLLFVINIILAFILVPVNDQSPRPDDLKQQQTQQPSQQRHSTNKSLHALASFWSNLQSCFHSWEQGSVIVSLLLFTWVMSATSFASLGSFYEDMYGIEPHHRGYISSYQQLLGFLVQSMLVAPILKYGCGGCERRAACWSALLLAVATMCELKQSLSFFLLVLCPAISLSIAMMNLSLRSLITQVAPPESIFSILAVLDVLQNAAAVTVPVYRTWLMTVLPSKQYRFEQDFATASAAASGIIQGDPDPAAWVVSSSLHWFVATALISYCLMSVPLRQAKAI